MASPLSLLEVLADIPDPRRRRGIRHPLLALLGLAILAMLTGCTSYTAIAQFGRDKGFALARVLGFRRAKTPTTSAYSVLFRRLDIVAFEAALNRWITSRLSPEDLAVLALDGKTLRGSRDGALPGQHLIAAYAVQTAAVVAQLPRPTNTRPLCSGAEPARVAGPGARSENGYHWSQPRNPVSANSHCPLGGSKQTRCPL